jgi:hypothetical protein
MTDRPIAPPRQRRDALRLRARADEGLRAQRARGKADWLVLAYLAGDNDLEGELLGDLKEMERVGSRPGSVEVLAQGDRARGQDTSAGNWAGMRRYYVTKSTCPDRIGRSRHEEYR